MWSTRNFQTHRVSSAKFPYPEWPMPHVGQLSGVSFFHSIQILPYLRSNLDLMRSFPNIVSIGPILDRDP